MVRPFSLLPIIALALLLFAGCTTVELKSETSPRTSAEVSSTETVPPEMPQLTFLGRASVKIKTTSGIVIYIDPYAIGVDYYTEPADYILITHDHDDHNQVSKVKKKESTEIIYCPKNSLPGNDFTFDGLTIKAVDAYNENHSKSSSCGYILTFDGIVLYHSGDTSTTSEMTALKDENITYALLCADGYYNMGTAEAMEVGTLIDAKFIIPIHTASDGYYSAENDAAFTLENTIHMKPGETIPLD